MKRLFVVCALLLPAFLFAGETFQLPFQNGGDRVYFDRPVTMQDAPVMTVTFEALDPDPLAALTIHLLKDGSWGTLQPTIEPLGAGVYRAVCPRAGFRTDAGGAFDWMSATTIRFSFWRHTRNRAMTVTLRDIAFATPRVALVNLDRSYLGSLCSTRVRRLLSRAGVMSADMTSLDNLAPYQLVVLPYVATLSDAQCATLKTFIARGGKLICFYLHQPALAKALAMDAAPYVASETPWRVMRTTDGLSVPATTSNLLCVRPRVGAPFATWEDGKPAVALTDVGAWFSHLPPLASVSAVALMDRILKRLVPDLAREASTFGAPSSDAFPVVKRKGVWFTDPASGTPGGWDACFQSLAAVGVTDAFVHLQTGGKVFFPIKGRSVVSVQVPVRPEDSLVALIAAGKKHGIAVHAWVICWDEAMNAAERFSATHTALVIDGIKALRFRGVKGIHLDYVRFPDAGSAAHRARVTSFVRAVRAATDIPLSAAVFPTPATALDRGQEWPVWLAEGLVDFVCPMMYADTVSGFATYCDAICSAGVPPAKVFSGLGYAADESQLDRTGMIEQSRMALARGFGGIVIFAYDVNVPRILK